MGNSRISGPLGWNDTFLDLDDGTLMCWAMLKTRIDNEYIPGLKRAYRDLGQYPLAAKRALLDMTYNLGLRGLSKFKPMNGHVEKLAWDKAADTCERKGIPKERNSWTRARLLKAMPAKGTP